MLEQVAANVVNGAYVKNLVDHDAKMFLISNCGMPRKFIHHMLPDLKKDGVNIKEIEKYLKNFWANLTRGKGIVFVGPVGTGKTAAMSTVLKYIFTFFKNPEFYKHARLHFMGTLSWMEPVRFWEASQLLSDYFNDRHAFNEITERPALGIDDITKVTQEIYKEALDHVLRHRDMNGLPTFLTSQMPLIELKDTFGTATYDLLRGNSLEIKLVGKSKRG